MQPPAAAYAILSAVAKFEETSRTTKRKWPGRKALQRNGDTLFLLFIPSPGYNGMGVAVAVLAMAGLLTRVLRLEQPLHPLMSECLQWHSLYSYSFLTQAQPRQAAQWHNLLEKYLTSRACGLLKLLLRACACRTCEMQACTASLDENSRLKVLLCLHSHPGSCRAVTLATSGTTSIHIPHLAAHRLESGVT